MNKERDLLPWILGGLSAAVIAVAYAAVSSHRDVPTQPQHAVAAHPSASLATPTTPATVSPRAAAPEVAPDAMPTAPALAQTAAVPAVSEGQIWECTTNGVKTFSNNPCGEKSTLLEVGPINTMNPQHAVHYMGGPGAQPRYTAGYADQSAGDGGDDYSDQNAEAGNSYTIVQGVRIVPRRRPEHSHAPAAPHNGGHNSGPVRRN